MTLYVPMQQNIQATEDGESGLIEDSKSLHQFQDFCVENNRKEIIKFLNYTRSDLYDEWLRNDLKYKLR